MEISEITDWNSDEEPGRILASVPFTGEKNEFPVKPEEWPKPNPGGIATIQLKLF